MKSFEMTPFRRRLNAALAWVIRRGVPIKGTYIVTVPGRKSGQPRSTPLTLAEVDGVRYLVGPYGEVGWVRNLRAAGEATLTRGRHLETVRTTEIDDVDRKVQVLKAYLKVAGPVVLPYFDAKPGSSHEAWQAETPHHPVFEVTPKAP